MLETLDRSECLRLLGTVPIGRVAFVIDAMPSVQPVNFVLHNGQIVFRTSPGSKLAAAMRNTVVAFEVDEYDSAQHVGWSVTAVGRSSMVADRERRRELALLPLQPWAPGERDHFVMISPAVLHGRRIVRSVTQA
jgi:nitroimidazol reductase NimA-like FMN-containing flavoprotein (pyridoxamine 5'-phosphate oxidase superfamily)